MKTTRLLFLVMLLIAGFGFLVSCGGGGGGGGNTGTLQPPLYNASGTWDITETSKNENCPVPAPKESYSISVNHPAGSNYLVVTALDTNMTYNGTISGSAVNYAGPSIDSNCPGGISLSVTLALSSVSYLSGSANWTCNYTGGSCSGTTAFTGTKAVSGGDITAPTAPTSLTGTVMSSSQINLSWSASTDNVGVFGYRLERCQGASCSSFSEIATPTTTSFSNTSLLVSTSYSYRVRAVDAAGNLSGYSNTYSATTQAGGGGGDTTAPTVPTNLIGIAMSSSQINLSWNASADNIGVTGYRVERCQGASCSSFNEIAAPATTSYSNTNLSASTSYSYRVRAVDAAGNLSGYSNTCSATTQAGGGGGDTTAPTAPTNLTSTATSSSQINLSWTASTDNVGVTGYKVYGDDTNPITPVWFIKSVTGISTSMAGLIASSQYCYRVSAVDAAGNESSLSNQSCATTLSSGPTIVTLEAAKDAEIAWSDASNITANTNFGNSTILELGNYFLWGAYVSSYLRTGILVDFTFDPATWSGKTITSAKLRLYVYDYAVQKTGRYVAYKIVDTMIGNNYQYRGLRQESRGITAQIMRLVRQAPPMHRVVQLNTPSGM
jgi:chitodextrinase